MKTIGGRFLQEHRGEVRKLFMHFPTSPQISAINFLYKIKNLQLKGYLQFLPRGFYICVNSLLFVALAALLLFS